MKAAREDRAVVFRDTFDAIRPREDDSHSPAGASSMVLSHLLRSCARDSSGSDGRNCRSAYPRKAVGSMRSFFPATSDGLGKLQSVARRSWFFSHPHGPVAVPKEPSSVSSCHVVYGNRMVGDDDELLQRLTATRHRFRRTALRSIPCSPGNVFIDADIDLEPLFLAVPAQSDHVLEILGRFCLRVRPDSVSSAVLSALMSCGTVAPRNTLAAWSLSSKLVRHRKLSA